MTATAITINNSVTRFVVPKPHADGCDQIGNPYTTTISAFETYSLCSDGPVAIDAPFADEMLRFLNDVHEGRDVDMANAADLIDVKSDIRHFIRKSGGFTPFVCLCPKELMLHLGRYGAVWDLRTGNLRALRRTESYRVDERTSAAFLNDRGHIAERVLGSLDSRIITALGAMTSGRSVDQTQLADPEISCADTGGYGLADSLKLFKSGTRQEADAAAATISTLYAIHQAQEHVFGNPMSEPFDFYIARFARSGSEANYFRSMTLPAATSPSVVFSRVASAFDTSLARQYRGIAL